MTDTTELDIQRRQHTTDGLSLWDRTASPVPSVVVEGSGQKARKAARPGKATSAAKRHLIATVLEAHGPLTRSEISRAAGMPVNTVNARVSEARALPVGHEDRVVTDGRRNGESIVHLARCHSLTYAEG